MRKLCMTVALVLGLCLMAGAAAKPSIPDEQLEALGRAIRLIPTDPQGADAAFAGIHNPIATGWRMYIASVTRPEDTAGYAALDREFRSFFEARIPILSTPGVESALEHVMYAYFVHQLDDPRSCIPVWLFKRHPVEADEASWAGTAGGYSSLFIRDSYCPQEWPSFLLVPEYRDYRSLLYEMDGLRSMGRCGGTMEYAAGAARWKWEYMLEVDVEFVKLLRYCDADGLRAFLDFWADKGIWEKSKVRAYRAQRAKTIKALAGWLEKYKAYPPEKAVEYGTLIVDGLGCRILGRYPKALLNEMNAPWYVFATAPDSSPDDLEKVLPATPAERNYMLHVCVLNHRPVELVKKLREAGASLDLDPENEVILAVDDAAYLEEMLSLGADVDHVNKFGKSALCYAAQFGYTDSARVLLAHGADVNRVTYRFDSLEDLNDPFWRFECYTVIGTRTPLYYACEQGSLEMIRLLLEHGADRTLRKGNSKSLLTRSGSPRYAGELWDGLLGKNPVMTPAEKEIARHLLAGE